jgi:hypothetical protein
MSPVRALQFSLLAMLLSACGGAEPAPPKAPTEERQVIRGLSGSDQARCEFQNRPDREVRETAGPGSLTPNIRRVYAILGTGEERRKVLQCREVDTNLDGAKDVVRTYNDQGEKLNELSDSDYDGRIDTWVTFAGGHIAKTEVDKLGTGKPSEWRYYVGGKISRVHRDTNKDGKADVWEVYAKGRLQRMGVDVDGDGRVDRWDRDEILARAEQDQEDRAAAEQEKERERRQQSAKEGPAAPPPASK